MRELYLNVSQHFRAGKLAKDLRRHSQKLRAIVVAMAMIFIAAPFYGQSWNLVTAASDLEVGDSVIIVSGNYALGTTQNNNNRAAVAITNNGDDVEFDDEAGVQGIKLVEGTEDNTFGFFVGNGYLYAAGGNSNNNYLKTESELDEDGNGSWLITISETETTIIAQGTSLRNNLRKNSSSAIFSCYGSGQSAVSIYKYEEGGSSDPTISLTQSLVDFSYNLNNGPSAAQSFSVEGSNLTADITVSVPDDADFELCNTEDGTYASSVTITPSEGTVTSTDVFVRMKAGLDAGAYNTTITIASTGATSKTISLTGSVVDPDAVYYTVVTEAPATDWTGEYLITYTNGNVVKALAGSSGTSPNYGTQEDFSEYLVGNKITANATTDAKKVTARSTSNGYTLYLENVGYLGWNSGNSLVFDEDVTDGRNEWTFSVSGEVVSITNVGTDTRSIKYNSGATRFACYTSGQAAITLYKSPREVQELIANPTFNPAEGTFFNSVDVTLACETEGTTIYYTLDGTAPTDASTEYTEAIHITETTTVKAIAIKNSASSEIVSATYTISNIETVATPVITPEAGSYNTPQQITITCETDEALIYYTIDGTDPTAESTLYTEPFTLSASATVKAIAVKEGMNNSQIASAAYTMPVFVENIAAIYALENTTGEFMLTGDVTFVFRNNKNIYVKDATGGLLVFDQNNKITTEYNEGDVISGGIKGTISIYNGLLEFVPTVNTAEATQNNGAVDPVVITVEQLLTNNYVSQLVKLEGVTFTNGATYTAGNIGSNLTFTQDGNSALLRNNFKTLAMTVTTDNNWNVTGFATIYNTNVQVYPRGNEDLQEIVPPAAPVFTPAEGTYTTSVTVTLACETEGATIYYTLNDTDVQNEYATPLTFTETTTIYAFAEKNSIRSAVVSATYTITDMETVATPTITPDGGNFEITVDVTLACETADASIYYTLDGTDPTAESIPYTEALTLTETTTIKAIAIKENMQNSAIAEATFTKLEPAVPVNYTRITSLSQLQDGDKVIIAARYDDNASHYYVAPTRIASNRFNGVAVETENEIISTDVDSVVWTVKIAGDTYKFVNASNDTLGYGNSGTAFVSTTKKEWTVTEYTTPETALVGTYAGYKIANVTTTNRSVAFRRYTDNNDVVNNTFGAYAANNAGGDEYNYALDLFVDLGNHAPMVARPTITPNGGEFETTVDVTLACETEDAAIYYTLTGETPTTESTLYNAPFTLAETTTVKAIAVKEGMNNSAVAEATFTKVVPTAATPTITPNGGNFEESVEVSLACETADASIYYTLDGTEPTAESTLYAEAFTLTATTTVKAIAVKEGLANSAVAEATFTKVEPPVVVNYTRITSLDQLHDGDKLIIASRYDDNADHYYVAPTRIASKLNGIAVSAENDIISTDVDSIVWTLSIEGDNYRFTNAADANLGYGSSTNFSSSQNHDWNIAGFTSQALVPNYAGYKISNVTTTNRCIAFKSGNNVFGAYAESNSGNEEYNFAIDFFVDLGTSAVATPVFTPVAGYYEEAQNVTITCATEGATIYYTTDGTNPTNESTQYTEAIAVSQNTTIKAIAYLGEEFSFVATARYTFPNFVENIAAMYEIENTTETYILTGDVTFVYRNGKSIYVKDATGGLLIFDQGNKITTEYEEGDVISGGITGTISMYHGMLEFVPSFNTAASTQNTGAVAPTVVTVEQLLTNNYVSQLVKVENVAVATGTTYTEGQIGSNVTFSQNGNEAVLRNGFKTLDMEIGDNTNWDITGFAVFYDEAIQIYPRNNDDVTIVTSVEELTAEITIYPNPTSNVINIAAEGLNVERVELANVDGQIVSSEEVASDMITVSLEAQPTGMYFVRIYTANEVIVRKVTKF